MRRVVLAFGIVFITAGALFAQVHIQEKAVITPTQPRRVEDGGTNNHVVNFTLCLQYQEDTAIVVVSGPNYFKVFSSLGCVSGEIQSPIAGLYYFTPCISGSWALYHSFDDDNCFDIYLDGDKVSGRCFSGEAGSYNTWIVMKDLSVSYLTPYSSKFDFSLATAGYMFSGDACGMNLNKVYDTTTTAWSSSRDPFTLEIVSGSQYASFHRFNSQTGNDVALGSAVTTVGDSIGSIRLDADGMDVESTGAWIIVEAQSNGLVVRDSVFLEPSKFDHFSTIYFEPPYSVDVQHMDLVGIGLEPMNKYNHDITIPDSALFDVSLDSAGIKYGSLQVGSMTGKVLKDVSWSSICWSGLWFVADGDDLQQKVDVHLIVTATGENVQPTDFVLNVVPEPVIVTLTPSVISPGDTATIAVKQRNDDGSLTDFSPDQQFEIGISSGENYGTILLSDGSTGGYFSYVSQPFQFIAADSIDADSVMVGIRVGTQPPIVSSTVPGGKRNTRQSASVSRTTSPAGSTTTNTHIQSSVIKSSAKKASTAGSKSVSDAYNFSWSNFGIGWVKIKKKPTFNLPPRYAQNDSRWKDSTYDHKGTIGENGCALCDMAWVLTALGYPIDPGQLNDWMNSRDANHGGYYRSDVNWNAINILSGGTLTAVETRNRHFGKAAYSNEPVILDGYLAAGDFVFAQVQDPQGNQHWVTTFEGENYPIMDPGFSQTSSLKDNYGKFWEYAVVSRSEGK